VTVKLLPLIEPLQIVTKDAEVVELRNVLKQPQLKVIQTVEDCFNAGQPTRIIVLKARQMGLSTIIEALLFTFAMHIRNLNGMVIAHEGDSSQHLLKMTRHYWETYWAHQLYTPRYLASNRLAWRETNSELGVATAGNKKAGRSRTLQFLHASEVAFWDEAKVLMTGLMQTLAKNTPRSFLFLESTANGIGNYFHSEWVKAESGDSNLIPLFFPWTDEPLYTASAIGMSGIPLTSLDEDERVARRYMMGSLGMTSEEADDRLRWRRITIRDECQRDIKKFMQEYPLVPEEAFIATGLNVFPMRKVAACYEPKNGEKGRVVREGGKVRFQPDLDGELEIFSHPHGDTDYGKYVVFGDPTRTFHGDHAVIQVIHRRTWEQVAEWRGRIDPTSFGHKIIDLAYYYNTAIANCEVVGPGQATIAVLTSHNYPYVWENQSARNLPNYTGSQYGWPGNQWGQKQEAIGNLLAAFVDEVILFHSSQLYAEAINYITIDKGFGNSNEEEFDDCVTAFAGALTTVIYEAPNLPTYGARQPPGDLPPSTQRGVGREDDPGPTTIHPGIAEELRDGGANKESPWEECEED